MTLRPHPDANARGTDEFPRYKVSGWCAHPVCGRAADHVHHAWRRSMFGGADEGGGDFAWVQLSDGRTFGNLLPLCWSHHRAVDLNEARIVLRPDEEPYFYWMDQDGPLVPLKWQPPRPDMQLAVSGEHALHANVVGAPSDVCPTCRRRLPVPKEQPEPGKPRQKKTWSVRVPVDERENGVEIIDTLMEAARDKLGRGDHRSWAYYTLVEALHAFVSDGSA